MRFLAIHNRHLVAGGEDYSHSLEMHLLRDHGHEVDEYLVDNQAIQQMGLLTASVRTIWSQESYLAVRQLLRAKKYSAVLVQNYFPLLSPSIFHACHAEGIPVLFFVRNFRLFCLNGLFSRQGKVCEDCFRTLIPYPGILHRCYRDSLPGSIVTAAMTVSHRLLRTWHSCVNAFVVLNYFTQSKLLSSNIPEEKIFVRPNFLFPDPGIGTLPRSGAIYVGRLSSEKGIDWLVRTWQNYKITVPLRIFGSGPLELPIKEMISQSNYIEFMGYRKSDEILNVLGQAKALILPSFWYEGMPRVILEAFACGTPVIASDLGGMRELIQNEENGYLFPYGNAQDLADKVQCLFSDEARWGTMSRGARASYENRYSPDRAYQNFMEIIKYISA